jgi:hypothetical protein
VVVDDILAAWCASLRDSIQAAVKADQYVYDAEVGSGAATAGSESATACVLAVVDAVAATALCGVGMLSANTVLRRTGYW